jgi:hypothetical protein
MTPTSPYKRVPSCVDAVPIKTETYVMRSSYENLGVCHMRNVIQIHEQIKKIRKFNVQGSGRGRREAARSIKRVVGIWSAAKPHMRVKQLFLLTCPRESMRLGKGSLVTL